MPASTRTKAPEVLALEPSRSPAPPPPDDSASTTWESAHQGTPRGAAVPMQRALPPAVDLDRPEPKSESVPLPPTEPEWFDGEEVYDIYRPADDESHDAA